MQLVKLNLISVLCIQLVLTIVTYFLNRQLETTNEFRSIISVNEIIAGAFV